MIYACAQKNAGPAGVTVVIIRKDLLERSDANAARLPELPDPRRRTTRCGTRRRRFAIYVLKLVTEWLLNDIGGLDEDAQARIARRPSCCTT